MLLAISATPLTAGALTVALAAGLARAEAASFDQVAIASCLLCAAFVTGQTAWRAGRLTLPWLLRPAERLANVAAARERFEAVSLLADPVEAAREDLVAAKSALIAAAAWEGRLAPESAASVGAYLAGNEAETLLFGLDRPALCCRPDGAVPLDPAERLAAAAALAEHAHALRPDYWFTAGALALVRLAQHRPTDARRLVRPHLEAGRRRRRDEDYRAQLLAVAAMTEVTGDPDRAIRLATSAWDALPAEGRRDHPAAPTIENVLTYVRRATRGASEASPS